MNYDQITVVAIYGNGQAMSAVPALERTAACLPGCKKLLITNEILATDIPQKVCGSLDYDGYSKFCMYALHHYIDTDYAFIVQHDGWALNKDNWKDEWLEYDYIGGLTHAAVSGDRFLTGFQWVNAPNPVVVQNGGFSLRSKRFMQALVHNGIMPRFFGDQILNNEDVQLTALLRPDLEAVGIKFAPDDESKLFSFEHLSPGLHSIEEAVKIFGHHSRLRTLLSHDTMAWHLTEEQTNGIPLERTVHDMFKYHYKYKIVYAPK
jgi:hypothetical protein